MNLRYGTSHSPVPLLLEVYTKFFDYPVVLLSIMDSAHPYILNFQVPTSVIVEHLEIMWSIITRPVQAQRYYYGHHKYVTSFRYP